MSKYSGDNLRNNRVLVDYENQRVVFDPSPDNNSFFSYYYTTIINSVVVSILLMLIPVLVTISLATTPKSIDFLGLALGLGVFITVLNISILFLNKRWRKEHFPKLQVLNASILGFGRVKTTFVINPRIIVNNKAIIPVFKNMELTYTTTEEFTDYLSRVEVENIFYNNPNAWMVIFTFSATPTKGRMMVRYL